MRALRTPGRIDQHALAGPDLFKLKFDGKLKFGGEVCTYPPAVELIPSLTIRAGHDLLRRATEDRRCSSPSARRRAAAVEFARPSARCPRAAAG